MTGDTVAAGGLPTIEDFTFTNTHLLVQDFEYIEPLTVEEAARALAEHDGRARVIAGGTDLLVQMKLERQNPTRLVSLARIPGLRRIQASDGLEVGAMASIRHVWSHPEVRSRYTALLEACQAFSTVQVMMMATLGGNLCNASPAADGAPPLLVFDASARLASPTGRRDVSLDGFFSGPGRTTIAPGELLESIHIPAPEAATGSAFRKTARVAADISKACAAVKLVREGNRVRECRIALGSVAPTPCRTPLAEAVLAGEAPTDAGLREVAARVREEIAPISDVRSTADYRRYVAGVLVSDALRAAWAQTGGGEIA